MPTDDSTMSVSIWTDGERADLVRRVWAALPASVKVHVIGGPRVEDVERLADQIGGDRIDDPRAWSKQASTQAPVTFLATMVGLTVDDLRAVTDRGGCILTVEPAAARLDKLAILADISLVNSTSANDAAQRNGPNGHMRGSLHRVPDLRQSHGWQAMMDAPDAVGPIRTVSMTGGFPRCDRSLFSQLFDAWRAVIALADMPLSIHASLVGAGHVTSDDLRAIRGDVSAHARLPDERSAVLRLTDRFGGSGRDVRATAQNGTWRVTDNAFTMRDSAGKVIDGDDAAALWMHDDGFARLIAADIQRLLSTPPTTVPQVDPRQADALACCMATLLSARTGEPESPAKLLDLYL